MHKFLNQSLDDRDREIIKPYFPYIKLMNTALDKLPKYKDTVWRGVKTEKDSSSKYVEGQVITFWSYTSTSKKGKVVQNFLDTRRASIIVSNSF